MFSGDIRPALFTIAAGVATCATAGAATGAVIGGSFGYLGGRTINYFTGNSRYSGTINKVTTFLGAAAGLAFGAVAVVGYLGSEFDKNFRIMR